MVDKRGVFVSFGCGYAALENHDGLIAGDIEALPAGWVWAEHLVVHPNQVVGRFGELRAIQVLGI